MKQSNSLLKINILGQLLVALFLIAFLMPKSFAKEGCCANHGGVAGCNSATGFQLCKDGSTSPTCACENSKKPATSSTLFKKPKSQSQAVTTPATPIKTTGCCKGHGGVVGCAANGHQKCKDGSISPSCVCGNKATTSKSTSTKSTTKTPKMLTTPAKPAKTTGCCKGHGGVARCNKTTGYQQCKDGTASATCKCS